MPISPDGPRFLAMLLKTAHAGRVRYRVASDVTEGELHASVRALADHYGQLCAELRSACEDLECEGESLGQDSGPVFVRFSELFPARTEEAIVTACLAREEESWAEYREVLNEGSLPREMRRLICGHLQQIREHRRNLERRRTVASAADLKVA